MHVPDLDNSLWIANDTGQLLLLAILIVRRLHRSFPIFSAYIAWQLFSDLLLFLTLSASSAYLRHNYAAIYFSLNLITYLFELGVLLEIAAKVLRPATTLFSRRALYWGLGILAFVGLGSFFVAKWVNPAPFFRIRTFLLADTTAATLCLLTFVLIAGFSQVLGLTWKNHILQLATGLAFYSTVVLIVRLMQSQLQASISYVSYFHFWSRVGVLGYLCTVSFWCYAFVKKEAPRQEFSPQMQKILVLLSGSAKRQHAVLARSREN